MIKILIKYLYIQVAQKAVAYNQPTIYPLRQLQIYRMLMGLCRLQILAKNGLAIKLQ